VLGVVVRMTNDQDDDKDHIAGDGSWRTPTHSMNVDAPQVARTVVRSDAADIEVDSIIGSYRIVKQIGTGGMASVFEGVHRVLPRRVAIKVMHPELRGRSSIDSRMIQEAVILDQLFHPGVARMFDCGILPDGRPWIAMELVSGESLAARIARDSKLSVTEVCNLIAAVADVLAMVHPLGIVHRDLKPDNILFSDAVGGFPLRVIDWGVAHLARLTLAGETCGTPVYMSPEQTGGRNIAPPCDIYSLGVMAYEALAGVPPFDAQTLAELVSLHFHNDAAPLATHRPDAPHALCALIDLMLHKTPGCRPTAADLRQLMQQMALAVLEDATEFASYAITSAPWPPLETSSIEQTVRIRRPQWTPDMRAGSGYRLVKPLDESHTASGEIERKR
jgi:serine/threonine-protein kinase